jgi:hypothetical protein
LLRRTPRDETESVRHETVFRASRKHPEAARAYDCIQRRGGQSPIAKWMENKMRALSLGLVLAFTLVLSSTSIAGSFDCQPNAGMFSFNTRIAQN